jgi:signal transduction histidine kinase
MGGLNEARGLHRRRALLVFLCVSLMGTGACFFVRSVLLPDTGLIRYDPEVTVQGGTLLFFPSAPFTAPLAAGLLPRHDRILSVNGEAVGGTRDFVRAVLGVRGFSPYSLDVQGDDGRTRAVQVTPYFRPTRVDWIFELVFCLMLGSAAIFLTWRMPHELFTIPLVLAILLSLVFACVRPFSYESIAANLLANAGNISSWLLVLFALYFPWRRGTRSVRGFVVVLVVALYAAFCILRALLYARGMATGAESMFLEYRRLGHLVIFSDGAAYSVLAALLASAYAKSRLPRDKGMLQWMLAGVLIAFPPYFFLDQLPLILGGPVHQVGLGSLSQLFLSILPLFLLLALSRRPSFNFRGFLVRYGIYGTLVVLTICLFGVAYMPLKSYIAGAYRLAEPLPELFAASILVTVLGFLRLPVGRVFSGSRPAATEGLRGLIQYTDRESLTLPAARLSETKSIIRGIVHALREPVRILAAGAARAGTIDQKMAGTEAVFFLGTLESLAGSPSSPPRPAVPEEIVREAIPRVKARHEVIGFELSTDHRGLFLCCTEELVQAVSLVLENAAEAREEPGAEVRIRCAADNARAVIEISDDGPGFDPLARRRLFRPFCSSKPGHKGLGLYFARIIVERNEGSIDCAGGENSGATVRLAFPRIDTPRDMEDG